MESISSIINVHGITVSSGLIFILWYLFIFKSESRSIFRLLIFPVAHFPKAFYTYVNPTVIPMMLGYVTFLSCLVQLFIPLNAYTYIIFVWGLIVTYEIYSVTSYILMIRSIRSFVYCISGILLIVGFVIVEIIHKGGYALTNQFDFAEGIYLFIVSVYSLARIITKGHFQQNIEAFFVFFGVILYSFLHTMASSILALDFVEHFDFAYYATLATMLFWIIVIPWILHLKYKLT